MPVVETDDTHADAFDVIECPCCGSDEWVELVYNGVYCDGCNTQCRLRETAGDQGFIAEFDSEGYTWNDEGVEPIPETDEYGRRASGKWLGTGGEYHRHWFSAHVEHVDGVESEWKPAWERDDAGDAAETPSAADAD